MKLQRTIKSYKELLILTFVIMYLTIKRFPIPLIVMGTISLGICLYIMKFYINRLISKNQEMLETYTEKKGIVEANITNGNSTTLDESKFIEEIRVFKKVIEYAVCCSKFYNYNGLEGERFIDERCRPFLDIVAPLLAVSPNEYQLIIQTRPSVKPYINKKIEEYLGNRPNLNDLKEEFHKVYNEFNIPNHNSKSEFELNNVTCAICMIDKYGFSQELLSVAKGIKIEIYNAIFSIYDHRLSVIESYYDLSYEYSKDPENAWKLR